MLQAPKVLTQFISRCLTTSTPQISNRHYQDSRRSILKIHVFLYLEDARKSIKFHLLIQFNLKLAIFDSSDSQNVKLVMTKYKFRFDGKSCLRNFLTKSVEF